MRRIFCRKFGEDVPQIIWAIMEPIIGPLIRVSINIQAHGRGLLARFRDHRLGSGVFKLHLTPPTARRGVWLALRELVPQFLYDATDIDMDLKGHQPSRVCLAHVRGALSLELYL